MIPVSFVNVSYQTIVSILRNLIEELAVVSLFFVFLKFVFLGQIGGSILNGLPRLPLRIEAETFLVQQLRFRFSARRMTGYLSWRSACTRKRLSGARKRPRKPFIFQVAQTLLSGARKIPMWRRYAPPLNQ